MIPGEVDVVGKARLFGSHLPNLISPVVKRQKTNILFIMQQTLTKDFAKFQRENLNKYGYGIVDLAPRPLQCYIRIKCSSIQNAENI